MDWEEHREGRKLLFMFLFLGWAVSSLASLFCYLKYEYRSEETYCKDIMTEALNYGN